MFYLGQELRYILGDINMTKRITKKETDLWGNEKEIHFENGKKIGETKFRKNIWGDTIQDHYDSSMSKIGETRAMNGIFGSKAIHSDNHGDIGYSRNEETLFGNKYQSHFDMSGKEVGKSHYEETLFGKRYKEHTGEFFKAKSSDNSESNSYYSNNSFGNRQNQADNTGNFSSNSVVLSFIIIFGCGFLGLFPLAIVFVIPGMFIAALISDVFHLHLTQLGVENLSAIMMASIWYLCIASAFFLRCHKKIAFIISAIAAIHVVISFYSMFNDSKYTFIANNSTTLIQADNSKGNLNIKDIAKIGPNAVWNISDEKWTDICNKCINEQQNELDCISLLMKKNGASQDAINFTRFFYREFPRKSFVYIDEFREFGEIGLAQINHPSWNHADTREFIIVKGEPTLVLISKYISTIDISQDINFRKIAGEFPNVAIGLRNEQNFLGVQSIPGNIKRFIFNVNLLNGCRGCEIAGAAEVAFDFDRNRRLINVKLLRLIDKNL